MLNVLIGVATVVSQCAMMGVPEEMNRCQQWLAERQAPADLPFSFVYDGMASSQCLASWKEQREEKGGQRTAVYSDTQTGLEVRWEAMVYPDCPGVEWVVYLRNNGAQDSPIIENIQALDAVFSSPEGNPILHYAKGAVCSLDDYRPIQRVMNAGARMRLQPGGGRSSSDYLPFFNLEMAGGHGIVLGVGWSGEWAVCCEQDKARHTHVQAGMDLTHLRLHPGETIRTPRIVMLFYEGESLRGQNLLRRFILAHARPTANGKPVDPELFASSWGGTPAKFHVESVQAIAAHDLPAGYYWIDAEWFGVGKWHQTAGDWRVKKDLYPDGFKAISDPLHAAGRKLLLWFEPERVCEGTPWYTEHADWLLDVPKAQRHYNWGTSQEEPDWVQWESLRNQIRENDRLFNLALPDARAFLTDYMSAQIAEFGLDCFRHDANIAPLEFWRAADEPERQGMTEIRWIEGLYAFWDGLLERHPGLIIDNCASGGRRIDIESLRRTTPLWRTDHPQDIAGRQCHTYGISSWIPLNATGCSGLDAPYSLRSTFSSIMDVSLFSFGDVAQAHGIPDDYPFERVKAALQEYRSVQKYFLGDYYPLSQYSQASDAWMAWQFDRSDLGEGMVQAFRRPDSLCESIRLPLRGLEPESRYTIVNLDASEPAVFSGKELAEHGYTLTVSERPGAAILIYRKEP